MMQGSLEAVPVRLRASPVNLEQYILTLLLSLILASLFAFCG